MTKQELRDENKRLNAEVARLQKALSEAETKARQDYREAKRPAAKSYGPEFGDR